jgi:NUC153 domain
VKLTWDQDDPERDRVTRKALSLKEIEDNDFHAYIASSSSSDDGTESMKKSIDHNELRALLLGGGSNDLPEGWAGSKAVELDKNGGDVDMEVTFRPALSGGKDEDETTLGRYQRRMREKRKKRKRDLKEKIKMDKSPVDDFFARSEGEEDSDGVPVSARRAAGVEQRSATRKPSTKEELSLLVAPDQPDSERKHFDMTAIIKAEKSEGKRLKGRKKKTGGDNDNELQDDFTIDVTDERFRALHEDYAFAIDPSNPR